MSFSSMRCRSCGVIQMAKPACSACGTPAAAPGGAAPAAAKAPAEGAPPGSLQRFSFHGAGEALFGIQIVNILLTLLSFGIYYFWGKTRVRSYLSGQMEFEGDRFSYLGTGKELLIGFLKASLIFGILSAFLNLLPFMPGAAELKMIFYLAGYAGFFTLISLARVGARRYRLSRTSWRGIRFSFRGSTKEFVMLYLSGVLLNLLTLGAYYPVFKTRQVAFLTGHSYFGNQKFDFDGKSTDLYRIYLRTTLVFIVWGTVLGAGLYFAAASLALDTVQLTGAFPFEKVLMIGALYGLGIVLLLTLPWGYMAAEQQRYIWNHTRFSTARFNATIRFGSFLLLKLGNLLLLLFSLGLAWPWATVRNVRYLVDHLALEGGLDLEAVQQDARTASSFGEALDGLLDFNSGIDIG